MKEEDRFEYSQLSREMMELNGTFCIFKRTTVISTLASLCLLLSQSKPILIRV